MRERLTNWGSWRFPRGLGRRISRFAFIIIALLSLTTVPVASRDASPGDTFQKLFLAFGDAQDQEKKLELGEAAIKTATAMEPWPFSSQKSFIIGIISSELANTYLLRAAGNRSQNIEKALVYFERALREIPRQNNPREWAVTEANLAYAYQGRIAGDAKENLKKSVEAFEDSLPTLLEMYRPEEQFVSSLAIAKRLVESSDWVQAERMLVAARELWGKLYEAGLPSDFLEKQKVPLFTTSALVALRLGKGDEALIYLDEGKAGVLAPEFQLPMLGLSDEAVASGKYILREARAFGEREKPAGAEARRKQEAFDYGLRAALRKMIKSAEDKGPGRHSPVELARTLANEGDVIVAPLLTFHGSFLLIAAGRKNFSVTTVELPGISPFEVLKRLGADNAHGRFLTEYQANLLPEAESRQRWPAWLNAIDALGPELWNLIGGKLQEGLRTLDIPVGSRLVFLPASALGVVPIGLAQNPSTGRRLIDDYEIVYAPNLESLASARQIIAMTRAPTLAAIVNPTGDLPAAGTEGQLVASFFDEPSRTVLVGKEASVNAVPAVLKNKSYWHFASHGMFDWGDHMQSALIMAGGQRLSLRKIYNATDLGRPRLVVLSACETGIYDFSSRDDALTGFPTGFMAVGAAGVISSLWPVNDMATSLLMAKFYDLHLKEGLAPPTALRQAQLWLRGATSIDIDVFMFEVSSRTIIPGEQRERLQRAVQRGSKTSAATEALQSQDTQHPFAHPYFWAGFVYTGE